MTTDPNPSSLGPSPGSGKYNVSLMDEDDDRDMYGAEPLSGLSSLNSGKWAHGYICGMAFDLSIRVKAGLNTLP